MALSYWQMWNGESENIPSEPVHSIMFRDGSWRKYAEPTNPARWFAWAGGVETLDDIVAYRLPRVVTKSESQ